jgi:putative ABC transport system permease protein
MTGGAVARAARSGVIRRPVQTIVIFCVVTAGAAAGVLGLTLATNANAQFLGAFTSARGADLAVTFSTAKATPAQLDRTRHLPGVTQATGPFPEAAIFLSGGGVPANGPGHAGGPSGQHLGRGVRTEKPGQSGQHPVRGVRTKPGQPGRPAQSVIPQLPINPFVETPTTGVAVVGRAAPGGRLDDITLSAGHWATRPGEIVLDPLSYPARLGSTVIVTSAPGQPRLKVAGLASSISGDQEAWVTPGQLAALRASGAPAQQQMLYGFASAGTTRQVAADLAEIMRTLPAGAVTDSISWLDVNGTIAEEQGLNTPFVVAFAIIALVLAVLITANVVSAAVVAGYQRIGVLKSIGFSPAQVTATYVAQIGLPAVAGAITGTILGIQWVLPLLNGGPFRAQPVPAWITVTVPLGMLALTGLAALVPAARAGRLSAVRAIAAGQAPRAGHGYAVHRLAARIRLPRPVTAGLAAPFTRPARSAVTLAAVTFGLLAVVIATGLDASLAKINEGADQWKHAELVGTGINNPGRQALTPAQQRTIAAALRAQPSTVSYLTISSGQASVSRGGTPVAVTGYSGDAAGLGWDIIAGTWYTGPGQVVVNTAQPGTAGLTVGQVIRMKVSGKTVPARVVGEVYAPGPPRVIGALLTSEQTFAKAGAPLPVTWLEAGTTAAPGHAENAYQRALIRALGPAYSVTAIGVGIGGVGLFAQVDTSLARLLTILVAALAALGVLNSVLMVTRERVHDLGVFKAVGMTPRQTVAMVTCWAIPPAVLAAVIALPVGMRLQSTVIHAIAADQSSGPGGALSATPGGVVHVYTAGGLALLALAGLVIAVIGALGPATWAAVSRTTTALRAE